MKYRNKVNGKVAERPGPDEWLEASAGWERVEEPAPKSDRKADDNKPDKPADDKERDD